MGLFLNSPFCFICLYVYPYSSIASFIINLEFEKCESFNFILLLKVALPFLNFANFDKLFRNKQSFISLYYGFHFLDSLSEWVKSLSHVRLFAIPWILAYQAPLSMGFSRQEYWSGFRPDNFLLITRHLEFYFFGWWIFLYSYKYSWTLLWDTAKLLLKKCDPFVFNIFR